MLLNAYCIEAESSEGNALPIHESDIDIPSYSYYNHLKELWRVDLSNENALTEKISSIKDDFFSYLKTHLSSILTNHYLQNSVIACVSRFLKFLINHIKLEDSDFENEVFDICTLLLPYMKDSMTDDFKSVISYYFQRIESSEEITSSMTEFLSHAVKVTPSFFEPILMKKLTSSFMKNPSSSVTVIIANYLHYSSSPFISEDLSVTSFFTILAKLPLSSLCYQASSILFSSSWGSQFIHTLFPDGRIQLGPIPKDMNSCMAFIDSRCSLLQAINHIPRIQSIVELESFSNQLVSLLQETVSSSLKATIITFLREICVFCTSRKLPFFMKQHDWLLMMDKVLDFIPADDTSKEMLDLQRACSRFVLTLPLSSEVPLLSHLLPFFVNFTCVDETVRVVERLLWHNQEIDNSYQQQLLECFESMLEAWTITTHQADYLCLLQKYSRIMWKLPLSSLLMKHLTTSDTQLRECLLTTVILILRHKPVYWVTCLQGAANMFSKLGDPTLPLLKTILKECLISYPLVGHDGCKVIQQTVSTVDWVVRDDGDCDLIMLLLERKIIQWCQVEAIVQTYTQDLSRGSSSLYRLILYVLLNDKVENPLPLLNALLGLIESTKLEDRSLLYCCLSRLVDTMDSFTIFSLTHSLFGDLDLIPALQFLVLYVSKVDGMNWKEEDIQVFHIILN